jgi:hypothetical protein
MDDLLRFPSAVKHDLAIDGWLRAQRDDLRPLVATWFGRMRRCGGDVRELMHDGCPTACVDDAALKLPIPPNALKRCSSPNPSPARMRLTSRRSQEAQCSSPWQLSRLSAADKVLRSCSRLLNVLPLLCSTMTADIRASSRASYIAGVRFTGVTSKHDV